MSGARRVRIVVEGRVQGVFFRASASEEARRLGVRGWVRNREDGAVELLAEGEAAEIASLVTWCHQGPPSARIDRVEVRPDSSNEVLQGFHVRR